MDGRDYSFVTPERFRQMVDGEEFLEHAHVFDHDYGTPAAPVNAALKAGRDVLFDIDWQGAQQLKQNAPKDMVSIFILPPSVDELERRLRARAQDSEDVIKRRMAGAANEISHWAEYDYVVINEDMETALAEIRAIVTAERLKRERRLGLFEFVENVRPRV